MSRNRYPLLSTLTKSSLTNITYNYFDHTNTCTGSYRNRPSRDYFIVTQNGLSRMAYIRADYAAKRARDRPRGGIASSKNAVFPNHKYLTARLHRNVQPLKQPPLLRTDVPPNMATAVWIALVRGEQSTTLGAGERPAIACRAPLTSTCPRRDKLGSNRTERNTGMGINESSQGTNERHKKGLLFIKVKMKNAKKGNENELLIRK